MEGISVGYMGCWFVFRLMEMKPLIEKYRKRKKTNVSDAMKDIHSSGLKHSDIQHLLKTPESELLGEIIRLNHTIYANTLDVIKVCTIIRKKKSRVA